MANIYLSSLMPSKMGGENVPLFSTSTDPATVFNKISTYLKVGSPIKSDLNFQSFDTAKLSITGIGSLTDNVYVIVKTTSDTTYWYITGYSFNDGDLQSIVYDLKLDYFQTYFYNLFFDIQLSPVFVEQRHCNRWYWDGANISPTWNYYTQDLSPLQYLSDENIVQSNNKWIEIASYDYDPTNLYQAELHTFAYGNIATTSLTGAVDKEGGSYDLLSLSRYKTQIGAPSLYYPSVLNPTFSILSYQSYNDDFLPTFKAIHDNSSIGSSSPKTFLFDGYSQQTGIASPYLTQHNYLIINKNIKFYVDDGSPSKTFSPIPPDGIAIAGVYDNSTNIVNLQDWSAYTSNLSNVKFRYQASGVNIYTYSSPYFQGKIKSALPTLYTSPTSPTPIPRFGYYLISNEFNRFFSQNPVELVYKIDYPINSPIRTTTKLDVSYETKLIRLCYQLSFSTVNKKANVIYHFDEIGKGASSSIFYLQYILTEHSINWLIYPNEFWYGKYKHAKFSPQYKNLKYYTVLDNFNQSFTLSSPAFTFLNQNKSVYNTSLASAEVGVQQSKYNIGNSFLNMLAGGVAGGVLGASKSPNSLVGGIAGGVAGLYAGSSRFGNSLYSEQLSELHKQAITSELKDKSRQPDEINIMNFKDLNTSYWVNSIGNPRSVSATTFRLPILLEGYEQPILNKIHNHFTWFGYQVNQIQTFSFNDNDDKIYGTRYQYNYWKIDNIMNALNPAILSIPQPVVDFFNMLFKKGVRLWNIYKPDVNYLDYSHENWEMNIYPHLNQDAQIVAELKLAFTNFYSAVNNKGGAPLTGTPVINQLTNGGWFKGATPTSTTPNYGYFYRNPQLKGVFDKHKITFDEWAFTGAFKTKLFPSVGTIFAPNNGDTITWKGYLIHTFDGREEYQWLDD